MSNTAPLGTNPQSDYLLTAADIAAFLALIRMQNDVAGAPTQARLVDFMAGLHHFAYPSPKLPNSLLRAWIEALFAAVTKTQTSYGCRMTGLYVAYSYYLFCQSFHKDGVIDFPPDWVEKGGRKPAYPDYREIEKKFQLDFTWFLFWWEWRPPGVNPGFFDEITAVMTQWGATPPATLIRMEDNNNAEVPFENLVPFGMSRFDPSNWTDAGKVTTSLAAAVSTAQSGTLTALLAQQSAPTPQTWLFLLYLLAAQCASTDRDRQRANTIVSAPTTSREYPNDTLINHLVYYTLMHWADPLGDIGWTNAQIQDAVKALGDLVPGQDPDSRAIADSLQKHGRILHSANSYPMVDPYAPSVAFDQRKTDTLFALARAWVAVKQGLAS